MDVEKNLSETTGFFVFLFAFFRSSESPLQPNGLKNSHENLPLVQPITLDFSSVWMLRKFREKKRNEWIVGVFGVVPL